MHGFASGCGREMAVGHGGRLRICIQCAGSSLLEFIEPGTELLDALCAPDWSQSVCLVCSLSHREVLYAFPPGSLVLATVEKACADRALCVLVVPVAVLEQATLRLRAPARGSVHGVLRPDPVAGAALATCW